ncbi:MAG: ECF transporter S component [Lachnospiraceae bacterium]|nr:ECF transporter S component [Lachnospiraceae bacterium]
MKLLKDTKALVATALMAAFTCVATMSIQIPTPTLGYIHPGDCLVLLCGIILGPVAGSLSAGIGSMFADILSGYVIYAIPTLVIKGVTALIAAIVFRKLKQVWKTKQTFLFVTAGILAEINMVFGYFLNKIIQTMFLAGAYNGETLAAGLASAAAGIFSNCIQGTAGIILGALLLPILSQVPDVRAWMNLGSRKNLA